MNAFEWMFIALFIVGMVALLAYMIYRRYAGVKLSKCSEQSIDAVFPLDKSSVPLACARGEIAVPSEIDLTKPTPMTITLDYALTRPIHDAPRLHVLNGDTQQPLVGELKSISCVGPSTMPSSPQALCAAAQATDQGAPKFVVQKFEANLSALEQPSKLILALRVEQPSEAQIIVRKIGLCFN